MHTFEAIKFAVLLKFWVILLEFLEHELFVPCALPSPTEFVPFILPIHALGYASNYTQ